MGRPAVGLLSATVDRLLHTTADRSGPDPSAEALALHRSTPVVDLVVGSVLFRSSIGRRGGAGHVDLHRMRAGGVRIVGLTIATRFPNLRGTLSGPQFRSLGMPANRLRSNMAIAEWFIDRIEGWCQASAGELRLLRNSGDLDAVLADGGPIGAFIGVQGAHVLDGELANVARLRQRGVRMLAPAHVMDNAFVGSATGRRRGGLSGTGGELVNELEHQHILVDLAHMSADGMADSLTAVSRPPILSHTALLRHNARGARGRRYSARSRNVADWAARGVADAGGVVGLVLSTQLLGTRTVAGAAAAFADAHTLVGDNALAIGSDMDGALRMVIDAAGLPRLTDPLLERGLSEGAIAGLLGRNALRLLRRTLEPIE